LERVRLPIELVLILIGNSARLCSAMDGYIFFSPKWPFQVFQGPEFICHDIGYTNPSSFGSTPGSSIFCRVLHLCQFHLLQRPFDLISVCAAFSFPWGDSFSSSSECSCTISFDNNKSDVSGDSHTAGNNLCRSLCSLLPPLGTLIHQNPEDRYYGIRGQCNERKAPPTVHGVDHLDYNRCFRGTEKTMEAETSLRSL